MPVIKEVDQEYSKICKSRDAPACYGSHNSRYWNIFEQRFFVDIWINNGDMRVCHLFCSFNCIKKEKYAKPRECNVLICSSTPSIPSLYVRCFFKIIRLLIKLINCTQLSYAEDNWKVAS